MCIRDRNYGYAGTKELNEALVSRFLVIDMPAQTEESLEFIFRRMFPNIKENARTQFIGVFLDLQLKATNSEISTKPCLLYTSGYKGLFRKNSSGY